MDNKEFLVGIEFLECIAKGFNPITGEKYSNEDLLRACDFVGRLEDLVRELRKDYDIMTGKIIPPASTGPEIATAPDFKIREIAKNIDKIYHFGSEKIKNKIIDFLLKENFLSISGYDYKGKPIKYATEKGKSLGVVNEVRTSSKGQPYATIVYSVEAQEYIIAHLTEIFNQ